MTPQDRTTTYTAGTIGGTLAALIAAVVAVLAIYGVVTADQAVAWVALGGAVVNAALAAAAAMARRHVPDAPDAEPQHAIEPDTRP